MSKTIFNLFKICLIMIFLESISLQTNSSNLLVVLSNLNNISNILMQMKPAIQLEPQFINKGDLPIQKYDQEIDLERLVNVTKDVPLNCAIIMFGYIVPVLLVVTILFNIIIVAVLLHKNLRTSTNMILLSISIFDMLTLLFPAPWYFYIFTLGKYRDYLHPSYICYLFHCMSEILPAFFHTASIWFTLLLAGQRYVYVCHPTTARDWCTISKVVRSIILITLTALPHQLLRFFDREYIDVQVNLPSKIIVGCQFRTALWVKKYVGEDLYFSAYYGFRILFVHAIPCIALVILNLLLFRSLKIAQKNRKKLFLHCKHLSSNIKHNTRAKRKHSNKFNVKSKFNLISLSSSISSSKDLFKMNKIFKYQNQDQKLNYTSYNKKHNQPLASSSSFYSRMQQSSSKLSANEQIVVIINENQQIETKKESEYLHSCSSQNIASIKQIENSSCDQTNLNQSINIKANPSSSLDANCNTILLKKHLNSSKKNLTKLISTSSSPPTSNFSNQIKFVNENRRQRDNNCTTLMLIVVVSVFLATEIPLAITTILHVVQNVFDVCIVNYQTLNSTILFTNFFIMLSYPVNFGIYCGMSTLFKQTFKHLFLHHFLCSKPTSANLT